MISVCVTVLNRSRIPYDGSHLTLFPNLVRSLARAAARSDESVELCVSDWMSTDWPLGEWLPELWGGELRVCEIKGQSRFSVGYGKNVAAAAAAGDTLVFVDADMLVPEDFLLAAKGVCEGGDAFFPVYWRHDHPEAAFWSPEEWERATGVRGFWGTGCGNAALSRAGYERAGGWPEVFKYGGEDSMFRRNVESLGKIQRPRVRGFVHQWHPKSPEVIEPGKTYTVSDWVWKDQPRKRFS
jgi:hypothetical protein